MKQEIKVEFRELNEDEIFIKYEVLDKQCAKICPSGQVTHQLFESILAVCDIFSLTRYLSERFTPEEAAKHLQGLVDRGFVKVFALNEYTTHSFVPMGWFEIKEITIKTVQPNEKYLIK